MEVSDRDNGNENLPPRISIDPDHADLIAGI